MYRPYTDRLPPPFGIDGDVQVPGNIVWLRNAHPTLMSNTSRPPASSTSPSKLLTGARSRPRWLRASDGAGGGIPFKGSRFVHKAHSGQRGSPPLKSAGADTGFDACWHCSAGRRRRWPATNWAAAESIDKLRQDIFKQPCRALARPPVVQPASAFTGGFPNPSGRARRRQSGVPVAAGADVISHPTPSGPE
jgi:hypothetical protein